MSSKRRLYCSVRLTCFSLIFSNSLAYSSAILRVMSETYERREHNLQGTIISAVPMNAEDMARPHVAWRF